MTAFLIFFFFLLSTFLDFSSWIWFLGLTPRKLLQFFAPQWHFFFSFPVWKVKTQFMIDIIGSLVSKCRAQKMMPQIHCTYSSRMPGILNWSLSRLCGASLNHIPSSPPPPPRPPSPFCWSHPCKRRLSGTHGWVVEVLSYHESDLL